MYVKPEGETSVPQTRFMFWYKLHQGKCYEKLYKIWYIAIYMPLFLVCCFS